MTCEALGCELDPLPDGQYCAFHECLPDDRSWRGDKWLLDTFGRMVTVFGLCWCGNRAKGHGLCANHLSQINRRDNGKVLGRPWRGRPPACHPERAHHSNGLCRSCYMRSPAYRAAARVREARARQRRRERAA